MNNSLKQLLSEDCIELFEYLKTNSTPESSALLALIEDEKVIIHLEFAILQITRIFGAYAFKNTQSVTHFKENLVQVYETYPEFKILSDIYLRNVTLHEINENLCESDSQSQTALLEKLMRAS
jgi:hypothetical protein